MCVWVGYAHVSAVSMEARTGCQIPDAGVVGDFKLSSMDSGNLTWVL